MIFLQETKVVAPKASNKKMAAKKRKQKESDDDDSDDSGKLMNNCKLFCKFQNALSTID